MFSPIDLLFLFDQQDRFAIRQEIGMVSHFVRMLFAKPNFNDQNTEIFHDFSVGMFQWQPGQCGTPQGLTGM